MKKRFLMLVTGALVMAAMMVPSAVPALARSCVAAAATSQVGPGQGNTFGQALSEEAKAEGVSLVRRLREMHNRAAILKWGAVYRSE